MKDKFNELIIGSGGLSGLSYIGSLDILNQYYPLKNFKYLTGCSAGAIICTLINIGYSIEEIKNVVEKINFSDFFEIKLSNLLTIGGFVDTSNVKNLFISMFLTKNIQGNITFEELHLKTNINLTLNSVNQTLNQVEYFNYENTPKMKIIDAVMMSMNIPNICAPIIYNNYIYFDGAMLDPYPYKYHKNTKKLGLIVFNEYLESFILNKNNEVIKNDDYFDILLNNVFLIYNNYLKFFYKKKVKNTIYIICNSVKRIELNLDEKNNIIKKGYDKTSLFLKKKIKKIKKEYLLKKYFNLLKFLLSINYSSLN